MGVKTLTGIKPTGIPHLGNYVGAMRPAIEASNSASQGKSYFFLADYHAIVSCWDRKAIIESTNIVAASWLACGLDPNKVIFYRQSDVPEIMELCWILTCLTAKGLVNRAHAYKAAVQNNIDNNSADVDKAVNMGLYCYPILMAADILMFNADKVPVGKDQIQHLEMTRDIAMRFNHHFGELFTLPEPVAFEHGAVLKGIDGQKMSKSYNNVIPMFCSEKILRKSIMKIKTNSLEPGEPKAYQDCILFQIFSAFATVAEVESLKQRYLEGIGWGELKQELFEYLNEKLSPLREKYDAIVDDKTYIGSILKQGAEKARTEAQPLLKKIKDAVGIESLR